MKNILFGGAAAVALLAVSPVVAQVAPGAPAVGQAPAAKAATRADAAARVQRMFARLDTNRDGFIVKAEADAARSAMRQRMTERRAQRGPRDGSKMFDRLDANKDGAISRAEFDAMRQQRLARRDRDGDGRPDARRAGMRKMAGMRGMRGMGGRMFEMADANRDGRVSLQEATAAAYQRFDQVDANRDGIITREERLQFRQQRRAQRQAG